MAQNEWISVEPEIWKPKQPEEAIEGYLVRKREKGGKYNKETYYIKHDSQSFVVFGTAVLENRMEMVEVDDYIKIVYRSTEKNKRNEDTKIFEVYKRSEPEVTEENIGEGEKPSSE